MPSGPGMPERRGWRRELGLSNSRLEGVNAKIRLIQRRGYGFRNLNALTAAIYLSDAEPAPPRQACLDRHALRTQLTDLG